ncbi:zinc ribbon domain-containing protein [Kitasatospora aureofaciens]|nr:zinc ribbon domain-containing protein [Kitasatospora aureofaciens]
MTMRQVAEDAGHTRYTYRLRVSSTASVLLGAEWGRCRWVWNECVHMSRKVHPHNRADPEAKRSCGPADLDKLLTQARGAMTWLREGASVPQQQTVRDFAKSRAKALAVEGFRPTFLGRTTMARKAADAAIGATKAALVEQARKHGRTVYLVNPAHTTMDCAHCGVRAKHRLPLSERIYTCTACGVSSPRDKNSARVMLVRAGLNPVGVDRGRPQRPPDVAAA